MNYHQFLRNPHDPADEQNEVRIGVGLKFLKYVAVLWDLSESQKRAILDLSKSQYQKIVLDGNLDEIDDELMVKLHIRFSWLLNIRKEIELTWPRTYWDEYMNAPHGDLDGKSLVDLMTETEDGLLATKKYVLASNQPGFL